MAEDASPTAASPSINTYHCLCSTLLLTTTYDLRSLPRRSEPVQDGALILAPPVDVSPSEEIAETTTTTTTTSPTVSSVLLNVAPDRRAIMIRREDGFEKRTLLRCTRCKLVVGYSLDEAHFEDAVDSPRPVYLLPGGMLSTADMVRGTAAEIPGWADASG